MYDIDIQCNQLRKINETSKEYTRGISKITQKYFLWNNDSQAKPFTLIYIWDFSCFYLQFISVIRILAIEIEPVSWPTMEIRTDSLLVVFNGKIYCMEDVDAWGKWEGRGWGLTSLLRMKDKNCSGSSSKRACTTDIWPPVETHMKRIRLNEMNKNKL